MRPINPYIVGNPVKDRSSFYGRQDIFREVMQVLHQRDSHAIVLYGQRRIGKTSTLLQLEQRLAQEGEFTPIYFDLQDKASKPLVELLYELAQHIARITGHTLQQPADFNRTGDYFRDTFLPGIAEKVASGGLVLLFDEFDVLDSPSRSQASQAFFPYLRTWMENVQKIKFVLVIGRRPEELSVRSMSTFKGIQSTRVSFMSQSDAEAVIRQSEQNGTSLTWEAGAVSHIYGLTHGHPYFTQLLCSVVWENNHEEDEINPVATADEVDKAVAQALKMGANAFNWLWDGLPPAERVIMSAMAEVKEDVITQEQLIETLNQSGVRLIARELELAPETLMDWELLYRVESGYRFSVPLLRRWVMANRPLRRVKDELDRLDPLADTLFQAGQGFYNSSRLTDAEQQLRQALNINPNHLKARLLLGRVHLDQNRLAESVEVLEAAYQYDERAARADLLKSLLALVELPAQDDVKQLEICDRILKIQPDQPVATEKRNAIFAQRGDAAFARGDYDLATQAYQEAGYQTGIEKIRSIWRDARLSEIPILEAEEKWEKIIEICEPLFNQFPDDEVIKGHVENARLQLDVTRKYNEAMGALENGMQDQARKLFTEIVSDNPSYGRASLKLVESIYGKVKISFPVPLAATLLTFLTSFFWTVITVLLVGGLMFRTFLTALREIWNGYQYVYIENFILFGIIAIPLVGALFSYFANRVVDTAYQVERGQYSYRKALWTHAIFGMGLFYLDKGTRRKWVYAIVAWLLPAIILGQLFYGYLPNLSEIEPLELNSGLEVKVLWIYLLILVVLIHVLSFIDVLLTCRQKQGANSQVASSPKVPDARVDISGLQPIGWRNATILSLPVILVIVVWLLVYVIIIFKSSSSPMTFIYMGGLMLVGYLFVLLLAKSHPEKFSWWKLLLYVPGLNTITLVATYVSSMFWLDGEYSSDPMVVVALLFTGFLLPIAILVILVVSNQKYGSQTFQTWMLFNLAMGGVTGAVAALEFNDTSAMNIIGIAISFVVSMIYFTLTEFKSFTTLQRVGLNISSVLLITCALLLFVTTSVSYQEELLKISHIAWPLLAGIIVSLLYKFKFNQILGLFRKRS